MPGGSLKDLENARDVTEFVIREGWLVKRGKALWPWLWCQFHKRVPLTRQRLGCSCVAPCWCVVVAGNWWKSWKRRFFVLKKLQLFYYKR